MITIVEPGLLTTIQDGGRWGHQHRGVSVSGAMDLVSLQRANRLVGNMPDAAALEVTLVGPAIGFRYPTRVAVCGAAFDLTLARHRVSTDTVIQAEPGHVLRFGTRSDGARAYVAVAGGIDLPPVLGSLSTHLPSRIGGLEGRPLRVGDILPVGRQYGAPRRPAPAARWARPPVRGGARVRVLPGRHHEWFEPAAFERLPRYRYTISPMSDRMGYRLEGTPVARRDDRPLLSQALPLGALQVPPAGNIIVAMADRQTSGGYPRIGTVISADIHLLGQLGPGDWVEFETCDPRAAADARHRRVRELTMS